MHKYIHLYRITCVYALTKLDERDYSCYFTTATFFTTSLQSQPLQICTWKYIWMQPKKYPKQTKKPKPKQKSADDALQIEAQ